MKKSTWKLGNQGRLVGMALACTLVTGCMLDDGALYEDGIAYEGEEAGLEDIGEESMEISYSGNGHDYVFVRAAKTWSEARDICTRGGYHLAAVQGSGEQGFLHSKQANVGSGTWWIGLDDQSYEGSWRWVTGESLNFTKWSSYSANSSTRDCALDYTNEGWRATDCSYRSNFVCERNSMPGGNSTFAFDVRNTSSATQNTKNYQVYLYAGQALHAGTCGVLDSWREGDTYLRVQDPYGSEIGASDDACAGINSAGVSHTYEKGSNVAFVAPYSGYYTIRAGCFSSNSCKGKVAYRTW